MYGWGFLAVQMAVDHLLSQDSNYVNLDPRRRREYNSTLRSNNTGEATAIGEELEWIRM